MRRTTVVMAMFVTLLGLGAGVAGAQVSGTPRSVPFPGPWAAGASIAASATADRSNDFSPDIAVNVDRTLAGRWSVRAEAGRVRWRFDGNPVLSPPPAAETLKLARLSLTAIAGLAGRHPGADIRPYVGAGIGYYHYSLERSELPRPDQLGLHLVAGAEVLPASSRFAVRLEAQLQMVDGPYDPQGGLAPTAPMRSHFISDSVLNLRLGVGVSRRF